MQIAIQSMFWMPTVDLATSSFILFTAIVRENIEVVEDVCEPGRAFERTYAWILAATEMNKTIQDETETVKLSQDNRIRKWYTLKKFEISMRKTINPAFLPVFFHFSLGVILLFSWWFWWWRDFRDWVWSTVDIKSCTYENWTPFKKFSFDGRRCWNSAV